MSQIRAVRLDLIKLDTDIQPRTAISTEAVEEYREALKGGNGFPPVTLFRVGEELLCADGWHRVMSYRDAGKAEINAEILKGTKRDAILYSVGANQAHGLRRTNADKRRAVMILLGDPEWSKWSDRAIAEKCGVSVDLVNRIRREMAPPLSEKDSQSRVDKDANPPRLETVSSQPRIGRDGRTINTAGISASNAGRSKINGAIAPDPPDIAKARQSGKIPADAVVEVTEPDESTSIEEVKEDLAERQAIQEEISDEDWCAALPLTKEISPTCLKTYQTDALRFRNLTRAREQFQTQVSRLEPKNGTKLGAYSNMLRSYLAINGPDRWRLCSKLEDGGCGGAGVTRLGSCPRCHGRGYWIP